MKRLYGLCLYDTEFDQSNSVSHIQIEITIIPLNFRNPFVLFMLNMCNR